MNPMWLAFFLKCYKKVKSYRIQKINISVLSAIDAGEKLENFSGSKLFHGHHSTNKNSKFVSLLKYIKFHSFINGKLKPKKKTECGIISS